MAVVPTQIIVVGGASVDVKAIASSMPVPATSNPGRVRISFGGVARNVAENLARLGVPVGLVSAIGEDLLGRALVEHCSGLGIDCRFLRRAEAGTDLYSAILSPEGEMIVAVASMSCAEALDETLIRRDAPFLSSARLLVCDANLSSAALLAAGQIARDAHIPFVIEPVSVSKAIRLRPLLEVGIPIRLITPNQAELAIIIDQAIESDDDIIAGCRRLLDLGVEALIIGLGRRGAFVASDGLEAFITAATDCLCDVTGAGDAALAAALWALNRGDGWLLAARAGQYAAGLAVATEATVSHSVSAMYLEARLRPHQPHTGIA